MLTIAARLSQQYPQSNGDKSAVVIPLRELVVGDLRQTLLVLLAAVGFVLLIACANVANLLLARAASRGRELVVRAAVGAGRMRLVRQMLTESVTLALIAGAGGVLLARWGVTALLALAPPDLPRLDEVTVDVTALTFALLVSIAASMLFGLAPAWHVARVDLADGLRQGGKGSALGVRGAWARKAFVVTEIALAVALVVGAGLLGRSLVALANVDMGFARDRLVVLRTVVPVAGREQFPRAIATYRSLLTELRGLPGVVSAGAVTSLPTLVRSNGGYWIQGGPGPEVLGMKSPQALFTVVTPDYFRTLQIPVARGRDFNDGDRLDAPFVAIINEQLAKDAFPDVDPIGRTIRCGLDNLAPMTIVGIVKDIRTRGPGRPIQAELYMPFEQHQGPATALNIVMRTSADDPLGLGATAARLIRSRNPEVPVRVETMEMTLSGATATPKFRTVLAGDLCHGRAHPGARRRLRRDGLHGQSTGARDRAARRAWCVANRRPQTGAQGRRPARRYRAPRWRGVVLCGITIHQWIAVWRVGDRSAGICRGRNSRGARCVWRLRGPLAPRAWGSIR